VQDILGLCGENVDGWHEAVLGVGVGAGGFSGSLAGLLSIGAEGLSEGMP